MAGRTRIRLAKMLSDALTKERNETVIVDPDDLHSATGWYRTSRHWHNESLRWDGHAKIDGLTVTIRLESFTPMTAILKSGGVTLQHDRALTYDVFDAVGN